VLRLAEQGSPGVSGPRCRSQFDRVEQRGDRGLDLALAGRVLAQMSELRQHVETSLVDLDASNDDASFLPRAINLLPLALLRRALVIEHPHTTLHLKTHLSM
jgi:hypothetical protein